MSKGKLVKFAETETFKNVLQPQFDEVFKNDFKLKGKWCGDCFSNSNKITLELGCGKGEYSVGLARMFPGRNFIGVDIKGSRIWKGAKEALESKLENVVFLRTRIELIGSFFAEGEVEEIWFTFPDPQLKKPLKRLTSSRFLNTYRKFTVPGAWINLKTDNTLLYQYTKALAEHNGYQVAIASDDIYGSGIADEILSIKTFYEKNWLKEGLRSHYIRFRLNTEKYAEEPPGEWR
ncbi:MAG: tRNA (guanosine(46)-N7)-methyltransferase TrmB [Bacteroidales bacterium]|nr:tRNA (guanosine(46)-N7)-methyltransferase TrmB [Bacteroidales bacterium]